MTVARLGRGTLGGGDVGLRGALGGASGSPASCVLRRAASATAALVHAGLLDAEFLGLAGRGEPARFGVDPRLGLGLLGGDTVDLLADLGQAVALAEPHRRRRRRAGAHGVAVPAPDRAVARDQLLAGLELGLQRARRSRRRQRRR